MSWQQEYDNKTFSINTLEPSVIVKMLESHLEKNARVADVGCGAGRNSLYLAASGCSIDASDIVDLGWLPEGLVNVTFQKKTADEALFGQATYDAIIMARLIQYLTKEELLAVFVAAHRSLKKHGWLAISYTASGGITDLDHYTFKKHKYSLSKVKTVLADVGFNVRECSSGSMTTRHVPHQVALESYDILAQKM